MALNSNYYENYIQLEYIQSDGRAYINTGVVPGDINSGGVLGYSCTMDAMIVDPIPTSTTSSYAGAFYSDNSSTWVFLPLMTGSSGLFGAGMALSGYQYTNLTAQQNVKFNISTSLNYGSGKSNFEVTDQNGGSGSTSLSGNRTNIQTSIYLFARNYYNSGTGARSIEYAPKMRIYRFTLNRTEETGYTPILDLIPSKRKSDNVLGLYDAVNDVFYTNAGSGSFVEGPAKTGYELLEYIESDGNSYINTGIIPGIINQSSTIQGYNYEGKVEFTQIPSAVYEYIGTSSTISNFRYRFVPLRLSSTNEISYYWRGANENTNLKANLNKKYYIEGALNYGAQSFVVYNVDDTSERGEKTSTNLDITVNHPLFIFASNNNGTVEYAPAMRLYYFDIWTTQGEDVHLREFYPARRYEDGVIGLWDKVNNVFYTNQGTGSFTAGPALSKYNIRARLSPIDAEGIITGEGEYSSGITCTLTFIDSAGCWKVKNWSSKEGVILSLDNPYSFEVSENITIICNTEKYGRCVLI